MIQPKRATSSHAPDILLQARRIGKRFGHRNVLNTIDLTLESGEVVVIFGPNGSGKSTLIRILSTLLRPTVGSLTIGGLDAFVESLQVRQSLGILFHEPLAYLELTPFENLKFFGKIYDIDCLDGRIADVLADVGLTPFAHEPVRSFSRGMVQRFMIAKALIHDPMILLFDEPFSGLDAAAKQFALALIEKERAHGKAVLLTTHDIELGHRAGSRFLFLLHGRLEIVGEKCEIGVGALSHQYRDRLEE